MGKCLLGVVLIVLGFATLLQGYPTEDLVVRLPGQPKVQFRQFAGYVDIDLNHGKSFFYYFVEADHHEPHKKPLTLWLNGGPGCSSVGGGAFTELGPFYPNGDGRTLRRNPYSWNKESNILFVESPAGVGWSYSNRSADYNTGDIATANDMLVFMLNWYEKFPSYKSRDLFLTGESYAGHYIPQLANAILDFNAHSSGFKFNVKGIAIGNPLLKLNHDFGARNEYLWSHGVISDEVYHDVINNCNYENVTSLNLPSCEKADNETIASIGNYTDMYDLILDVCNPSLVEQEQRLNKVITQISLNVDVCIEFEMSSYLNLPEVQKALHANHTNLPYEWTMCSQILNYSDSDPSINILPVLKRIVGKNIPIWVYSGDEDGVIPLIGSRTHIRNIAHELKFNITVPYRNWINNDQVGGWVTEYGNLLTFATVRGASHMVPFAQPSRALQLFTSFVNGKRLPSKAKPIDI